MFISLNKFNVITRLFYKGRNDNNIFNYNLFVKLASNLYDRKVYSHDIPDNFYYTETDNELFRLKNGDTQLAEKIFNDYNEYLKNSLPTFAFVNNHIPKLLSPKHEDFLDFFRDIEIKNMPKKPFPIINVNKSLKYYFYIYITSKCKNGEEYNPEALDNWVSNVIRKLNK